MRCPKPKWICPDGRIPVLVPCGKCLACLTNRRNEWAFRLEQEYKHSQGAVFVTLTYHPKYYPDYGLDKKHVQKYMKRLRKLCGQKLRYFAVGEYGTKTGRAHYHIILFNYGNSEIHREIERAWCIKNRVTKKFENLGIVDIRPINLGRIMYCTKYVIQRGDVQTRGNSAPFMLCSRAYGIGLDYLSSEMVEYHRRTEYCYTLIYGEKGRLARYYRDKIWWPFPGGSKEPRWREHPGRERIKEKLRVEGLAQEERNRQLLREAGYSDPDKIQAEMWDAVLSRVKQKTAYSQII